MISCGGGALGEPERKGEGQCGNMRLLRKQRKRVLMGRSDVAGWGIFLQSAADKDDLIGEYTGELISDEEADYVIDPIRTGSELKFANHSANPNCYAKISKVAGDDRLGIYAKKRIEAGEEIFYDYCYPNEVAPVWALKPLAGPPLPPPSPRPPMDR
ncbi:histone-lysine N-methyltransferase EZA1-like protein [Tanacetum coccineum]